MTFRNFHLRTVFAAFAVVSSLAGARVPGAGTVGGRDEPDFRFVGPTFLVENGKSRQVASGVAVAPQWILTVAHAAGKFYEEEGERYEADKVIWHPEADLVLMHLKAPVRRIVRIAYPAFSEIQGKTIRIVGTGFAGRALADGSGFEKVGGTVGKRRSAANVVDAQDEVSIMLGSAEKPKPRKSQTLVYDFDKPGDPSKSVLGSGKAVPDEGTMLDQDSGGGWFVKNGNGWDLVAISAYVAPPKGSSNRFAYGGVGMGIYLAQYRSWIEATMKAG